jgi:hypothetical protein
MTEPVLYTHQAVNPVPCCHTVGCTVAKGDVVWALHYIDGTRKTYCGRHYRWVVK